MALVGVFDDVLTVKPSTKLVMQISLASMLVFLDYRLGWTDSLVLDAMLTLLWVVGITNSFNLLDNMDGLCAGIALIAGTFLLGTLYAHTGVSPISMYLAVLLGATAGFLVYNLHPATIFMGDTGSLFLGFNLAALTLLATSIGTRSGTVRRVVGRGRSSPAFVDSDFRHDACHRDAHSLGQTPFTRRPGSQFSPIGGHRPSGIDCRCDIVGSGHRRGRPRGSYPVWRRELVWDCCVDVCPRHDHLCRLSGEDPRVRGCAVGQAGKITPLVVDFMYKRRVAEVLLDLCLNPAWYYSAYRLRFEGEALTANYPYFLNSLPVVLTAQLLSLFVVGGYRGTWRHFGIMDAVVLAKSVALGTTVSILAMVFAYHFASYSRAVFVIYSVILMLLLCSTRASFRLVGEFITRRQATGLRCVVYGTSGASLATLREAFGQQPFKLLGFVDDDPSQMNARVSGYPVLGDFSRLLSIIESGEVDRVVMNTNLIDLDKIQRLHAKCEACGVELMICTCI